jgi:hypothetical protein
MTRLIVVAHPYDEVRGWCCASRCCMAVRTRAGWDVHPFGSICNRRSLLAVGNLVDAVLACLRSPLAGMRVSHIADEEPVSTPNWSGPSRRRSAGRPGPGPGIPPAGGGSAHRSVGGRLSAHQIAANGYRPGEA